MRRITRADDGNAARFMRYAPQQFMVSVPSLVEHNDFMPSVKGGASRPRQAQAGQVLASRGAACGGRSAVRVVSIQSVLYYAVTQERKALPPPGQGFRAYVATPTKGTQWTTFFQDCRRTSSAVSDEDLKSLIEEHEAAKEMIAEEKADFLGERSADEILAQLEKGGNQYQLLLAERSAREKAHENYTAEKAAKLEAFAPKAEDEEEEEAEEEVEEAAEGEMLADAPAEEAEAEKEEAEVGGARARSGLSRSRAREGTVVEARRFSRTPPAPQPDRVPAETATQGAALLASGEWGIERKEPLDRDSLARSRPAGRDPLRPHAEERPSRHVRDVRRPGRPRSQGHLRLPGGAHTHR